MKAKKLPFSESDGGMASAGFSEENDCGVRAFAHAAGKTYAEVHRAFEREGRRAGRGSGWNIFPQAALTLRVKLRTVARSGTVGEFVAKHPTGRFLVTVAGHAFAVCDGTVFDTWRQTPGKKIKHAWQVTN